MIQKTPSIQSGEGSASSNALLIAAVALFVLSFVFDAISGPLAIGFGNSDNDWRRLDLAVVTVLCGTAYCLHLWLKARQQVGLQQADMSRVEKRIATAFIVFALFEIALFLSAPYWYRQFNREDSPVEYAQFGLYAVACGVWIRVALVSSAKGNWMRRLGVFAALGFFFVAGEEISWGQRIIGFGTPDFLQANGQGETNLHNFGTTPFNIAYAWAAFITFGILPFVTWIDGKFGALLEMLRPGSLAILVYACGVGFHSGYIYQLGLLMILQAVVLAAFQFRQTGERRWLATIAVIFATSYVCFFHDGLLGDRWFRIDETREFFFASAIVIHSLAVLRRTRAA